MNSSGSGSAHTAMIAVVNHDVPTDPAQVRARQIAVADAAVASAEAKVRKLTAFASSLPKSKQAKQRAHLVGANKALAEAIATRKGIR